MKFARYLEDTQTPEWQRAYINYRLLKKRITAIRRANGEQSKTDSDPISTAVPAGTSQPSVLQVIDSQSSLHHSISSNPQKNPPKSETATASVSNLVHSNASGADQSHRREPFNRSYTAPPQGSIHSDWSIRGRPTSLSRMFSSGNSKGTGRLFTVGPKPHPYSELPLRELIPLLSPPELAFFSTLDAELDKIETFYIARQGEMHLRTKLLEDQLDELAEHRRLFHAAHPSDPWAAAMNTAAELKTRFRGEDEEAESSAGPSSQNKGKTAVSKASRKSAVSSVNNIKHDGATIESEHAAHLDPEEYYKARHKLKKAVLEHYRGLEVLHNYRILNLTGIRKALKKFQKVTKIAAQNAYMSEQVDKTSLASGTDVRSMMDKMEELYATRFAHGDKKKASNRLRSGPQHKSHHISTFVSGIFIGLAVPAFASGLFHSYQESTRDAIPGWDALLLVYGVLVIPVVFSFLVGLNMLVWAHSRINYVFIFELDPRTRLDHREYFEVPSILLAALCYTFWLSFAQIGAPVVSPAIWPLVFLGFTVILLIDPLPILFKSSRYWLLKSVGKLLTSGTRRVEFSDFWMGDQFCSLVFTLSNLYLVVCLYVEGFNSNWRNCGSKSSFWPLAFALAILPFLVRLIQSIKRYVDSGLDTHLINGGKYFTGIIAYLCYFIWRHKGPNFGPSFAVWCIVQTAYSLYAGTWDLLMDWSIFGSDEQHRFMRKELVYSNHIYLYYFAVISNTLIRFIWIIYIPSRGPDITLRTFIVGFLEMLRRWQWNFYRVENEHLGNVDQYRVTREVPLPYALDDTHGDDADDDDEGSPFRRWFPQRAIRLRRQVRAAEV